ncbi:hypothetical protein DICPUDRAFT_149760 [Dictyostelium purpureum]|uniref:Cathepsin J n=1 Tax=Dictyostelium purpureum TaxID=5786 RepID=F0ZEL3_DICPU|nr:uncharacterized protein DICPUDRAFT_149760 [Dictyostelium purpureum]EGC37608.1 hypothetical protein DICPUDRAFT_149760 [Dictyostelium purpureum]|eukprot:XP_003285869.1 hypothetical protein DICPUDRAFT_149760 [Dictyostelium purpureum]
MKIKTVFFIFLIITLSITISHSRFNYREENEEDDIEVIVKVKVQINKHTDDNYVELDDIEDEKCNRCKYYEDKLEIEAIDDNSDNEDISKNKGHHYHHHRDVCGCLLEYYGKECRKREFNYQKEFIKWSNDYNKTYTANNFYKSYEIFKDSYRYIEQHSKKNDSTYKIGLNEFADISPEEFAQTYLIQLNTTEIEEMMNQTQTPIPTETPSPYPNICNIQVQQEIITSWITQNEKYINVKATIHNLGSSTINSFTFYLEVTSIWEVSTIGSNKYGLPHWRPTIAVNDSISFSYIKKANNITDLEQVETRCESHSNKTQPSNKSGLLMSTASADWSSSLPPVKNQGSCGSCYAFASITALEGALSKKGIQARLSEQEIVDCTRNQGNNGCSGGWFTGVYDYIRANKGVSLETGYPYTNSEGTCRPTSKNGGINSYVNINNERSMTDALTRVGPIAVALQAGVRSFQLYQSGLYNDAACGKGNIDHAVTLIGEYLYL